MIKNHTTQTVQKPSTILNSRSHISYDIAMKKYHNDIGNRLSEMLVQDHYTPGSDDRLSQDFCMLTIDTRHLRSLKHRNNDAEAATISRYEERDENSDVSSTIATTSYSTPGNIDLSCNTNQEKENRPRGKRILFDKLTCSLFLRKHTCARCKRKSRSCVSNKAFSRNEKRYICLHCRKTSQLVKNSFDVHSSSKNYAKLNSTSRQSIVSSNKDRGVHIPSRKNIKDSGYDTVTSCSTVASAYSAFSTPANIRQNINKDRVSAKPVLFGDQGFNSEAASSRFQNNHTKYDQDARIPCVYSDSDLISEDVASNELEINNFLPVGQTESSENELAQLKQININTYDGYFSEVDINTWGQNKSKPALSDTSTTDDTSENGDYCYFPPRIIRVSQSGKNTNISQKSCYTCDSTSKQCFRLPWEGGWICEDCLDGLH